jgi:hypothetical protein
MQLYLMKCHSYIIIPPSSTVFCCSILTSLIFSACIDGAGTYRLSESLSEKMKNSLINDMSSWGEEIWEKARWRFDLGADAYIRFFTAHGKDFEMMKKAGAIQGDLPSRLPPLRYYTTTDIVSRRGVAAENEPREGKVRNKVKASRAVTLGGDSAGFQGQKGKQDTIVGGHGHSHDGKEGRQRFARGRPACMSEGIAMNNKWHGHSKAADLRSAPSNSDPAICLAYRRQA